MPSEEDLFEEALAINDPRERTHYLTRMCQGNHALRHRVESLLAAYHSSDFLESPVQEVENLERMWPDRLLIGSTMASYSVLELLGEGGMGDVYLARRMGGQPTHVALKVIKPGMDSRQVIARFELERAALARMDHPHIAQLIEAGVTPQGRAYFAMELVQGLPITAYCDQQRLDVTQRVKLMIDLCCAVQHAHSKGLVHRDLKPSNVLVTEVDGEPIVKVIDFGVAKALDQEFSEKTIFTRASQLIGTPLYMSPEQVRWCPNVDIRSDVYSLGVLLYELLSGAPPFAQDLLKRLGFEGFRRVIQEDDPPLLSQRIAAEPANIRASLAAARSVSPTQLRLQVRGDLDWIALTALAKDPQQRYSDPGALAEDLRCYLTHRIIAARRPRWPLRARKWARRHPGKSWSILATMLAVTAFAAAWQIRRVIDSAQVAAQVAVTKAHVLEYVTDVQLASASSVLGNTRQAMSLLDKHQPQPDGPFDVGFEWHYLRTANPQPLQRWDGHRSGILMADVAPDGRWIVSCDRSGEILLWDPATGQHRRSLRYGQEEVTTVRFSPDGKWLATAGVDRVIHLWETGTWREVRQLRKHANTVCDVAWSPDGKQLATGGRDGKVHLWEVVTGSCWQTLGNNVDVVRCVAWSPDGRYLASGNGSAGGINLWDASSWQLKATYLGMGRNANAVAFSEASRLLAFGGYGGRLAVVDLDQQLPEVIRESTEQIWSLKFLPGERIAVGRGDGSVETMVWRRDRHALESHWIARIDGNATLRAILPIQGGRRVVLASEQDCDLKCMSGAALWGCHVEPLKGTPLGTAAGDLLYVDRNSRMAVRTGLFGTAKTVAAKSVSRWCPSVYSAATGRVAIAESPSRTHDPRVRLYDATDWHRRTTVQVPLPPQQMSFSRDGRYLVGSPDQGALWRYDLLTDKCEPLPRLAFEEHPAVAFSPTDDLFVLGQRGQHGLHLLRVPSFDGLALTETLSAIHSVAFHPDGQRIAVGEVGSISIRDVATLQTCQLLRGHPGDVVAVAFSPNGRTLASVGADGIRVWNTATGAEFFAISSVSLGTGPQWLEFVDATTLLTGNGTRENFFQYGEPLGAGAR